MGQSTRSRSSCRPCSENRLTASRSAQTAFLARRSAGDRHGGSMNACDYPIVSVEATQWFDPRPRSPLPKRIPISGSLNKCSASRQTAVGSKERSGLPGGRKRLSRGEHSGRDQCCLRPACSSFSADFDVFERKQYCNLSHEPNKAMNLNSYPRPDGKTREADASQGWLAPRRDLPARRQAG